MDYFLKYHSVKKYKYCQISAEFLKLQVGISDLSLERVYLNSLSDSVQIRLPPNGDDRNRYSNHRKAFLMPAKNVSIVI